MHFSRPDLHEAHLKGTLLAEVSDCSNSKQNVLLIQLQCKTAITLMLFRIPSTLCSFDGKGRFLVQSGRETVAAEVGCENDLNENIHGFRYSKALKGQ
jgi:hypothetical protein